MTEATEAPATAPAAPGPPRRPLLQIHDLTMSYDAESPVLTGVSLDLLERELVAVVGPSGCGKSTLLQLAAGLEQPDAGTVDAGGSVCSYVFQDPALLEWRTALGNVELVGELTGLRRPIRRSRALEALALVGLSGFEHHHPRQLSGGMRMRVSLARALVSEPRLALFDEPFGALDEITRLEMQTELQRLVHDRALAALLVTHSVPEAVYLGSRVMVLSPRPGQVVAELPIPFPYPRPPSLRHSAEFARLTGEVSEALSSPVHEGPR